MSLATFTERRTRLRELLARDQLTIPGSVFDATSARLAQAAGYEMGLMGGSVASAAGTWCAGHRPPHVERLR